jgi:DMSO/TMAO reductase YedYZ molybdopterin-dependent catalytic subunit
MNEKFIAAKRAGQPLPVTRSGDRLPPGQREVDIFPVLDMGIHPGVPREQWRLKIHGLVDHPVTLDWEQFMALEQFTDTSDFHCVTTWSQFDMDWQGVSMLTLIDQVKPQAEVTHVFYKGYDGYSTNTTLEAVLDDDTLVAHTWNRAPLAVEHGGPARVIIPKLYAWKGAKWVNEIIFLDRDILGFWEVRGYSNTADPWTDDRFS